MNFTLRFNKDIMSAAVIAVLLFAGGSSARATDQLRAASVNRPSGTTTVGMIEIPAVGLATRVLEGSNASTHRIVLPDAIEVVNDTQLPTPTLVTCCPFDFIGDAPQRLIVHAERVPDSAN
jgi:sortase (surface protein transpeptidase)